MNIFKIELDDADFLSKLHPVHDGSIISDVSGSYNTAAAQNNVSFPTDHFLYAADSISLVAGNKVSPVAVNEISLVADNKDSPAAVDEISLVADN